MQDWQVSLWIQAQALLVDVEAMKATNEQERIAGNPPQYGEAAFYEVSFALGNLATEIRQT